VQNRSRAGIGLLLLAVAVSAAARLWLLLERPLWFDEIFTVWAARLPFSGLLAALRSDSGPPGFYLIEKPFVLLSEKLSGAAPLARAVPFLATLALFAAARTLSKGAARATLILLLSSSTLLNLYAAEARPYALLAALNLALFLLALRGEERFSRLAAIAVLAAAALYTHYLAVIAVGALLLLCAVSRRWRSGAALAAGGAAFLPWLPVLRTQPAEAIAWMRETPGGSLAGFLSAFGGVGRVPASFGPAPAPALFFAALATGGILLVLLSARARTDPEAHRATVFVLLVLGGALLAGLWRPIAFAGRTEMAVLPVFLWAAARAAAESRAARWAAGAAAALGILATAGFLRTPHADSPASAVAASLAQVARPNDVVVAAASFYLPSRLASERGELAASVLPMPEELGRHPGWFVPAVPGQSEERALAEALDQLRPGGRLFVALPPLYATPGLRRLLAEPGGRTRALLQTPDALVILRTPEPRPSAPAPVAP
jgi:hypothetical protein